MPPRPERHEGELISRIIAPYPRQEAFALCPFKGLLLSVERKQHIYYTSEISFVNPFFTKMQKTVKNMGNSGMLIDSRKGMRYIDGI